MNGTLFLLVLILFDSDEMFPFLLQNGYDCIDALLKTLFQTGFCLTVSINLTRKISGKATFERYTCY